MGSGSLNAMAVFEAGYKCVWWPGEYSTPVHTSSHTLRDDMTRQEAIDLVAGAIRSGVYNDLGSGSNVDVTIITKEAVEYLRNYQYLQGRTYTMQFPPKYPRGTARAYASRRDCDSVVSPCSHSGGQGACAFAARRRGGGGRGHGDGMSKGIFLYVLLPPSHIVSPGCKCTAPRVVYLRLAYVASYRVPRPVIAVTELAPKTCQLPCRTFGLRIVFIYHVLECRAPL